MKPVLRVSFSMDTSDVLILGAGISGLLCATELNQAGVSVQLLDKGRGVGGRMSTRRMSGARLDHGAQFFTVREAVFQTYVDDWLRAGIVREWFNQAPYDSTPGGYPRYCGVEGMNQIPRYLAQTLNVHCSERVNALEFDRGVWSVSTDSKKVFKSHHLVITAPLPQSLMLLLESRVIKYVGDELEALKAITYQRGLTTLAILEGPSGLPKDGFLKLDGSPVTWIADNQIKKISEIPCVTIQSSSDFAEEHWNSKDKVRGPLMIEAIADYLKSPVSEYVCHRWGFALSENRYKRLFFHNPEYKLALAGDAFSGGRVEGAALSGIRIAEELLERCNFKC